VARAQALLAQMGLTPWLTQSPARLSGGQQSRVAIARALVTEPALLLMDEPFAALDAITREELQDDLAQLCQTRRTSVLFVTHDMTEAVMLADRVASDVVRTRGGRCTRAAGASAPARYALRCTVQHLVRALAQGHGCRISRQTLSNTLQRIRWPCRM